MQNRAGVILTALLLALLCGCAPARPAAVYQNPIDFYYCDLGTRTAARSERLRSRPSIWSILRSRSRRY